MTPEQDRDHFMTELRSAYAEQCVRLRTYPHAEAFRLMEYAGDNGLLERIWNSRNGVTPFCVSTRDGKGMMQHSPSHWEETKPQYRPAVGSRIFVDVTPEDAIAHAEHLVAQAWNDPDATVVPLREIYVSREAAVRAIALQTYEAGIPPRCVTVTEEMARARGWT